VPAAWRRAGIDSYISRFEPIGFVCRLVGRRYLSA
jgi:hypothetical protein